MKSLFLIPVLFLLSISSYAQMDYSSDVDVYMQRVLTAHSKSEGVLEIKQKVEEQYDGICEGSSTGSILLFYFPVTYKAKCYGKNQTLILKIHSVHKGSEDGKEIFKIKSYKVKL